MAISIITPAGPPAIEVEIGGLMGPQGPAGDSGANMDGGEPATIFTAIDMDGGTP